jgi:hypothetical protein
MGAPERESTGDYTTGNAVERKKGIVKLFIRKLFKTKDMRFTKIRAR